MMNHRLSSNLLLLLLVAVVPSTSSISTAQPQNADHHRFSSLPTQHLRGGGLTFLAEQDQQQRIAASAVAPPVVSSSRPQQLQLQKRLTEERSFYVGAQRLLAVRVTSTFGEAPGSSLDAMEGAIFGTGPNPDGIAANASVVAQFRAVSHNQLLYVPANATVVAWPLGPMNSTTMTPIARPGLLEIEIAAKFKHFSYDFYEANLMPIVVSTIEKALGRKMNDIADRIMLCLPSGSFSRSVAGLGDVGGEVRICHVLFLLLCVCIGKLDMFTHDRFTVSSNSNDDLQYSYYQGNSCTSLDVMMHELGHNLNFHHSSIGHVEYGDRTGYMGGAALSLTRVLPFFWQWSRCKFLCSPAVVWGVVSSKKAYVSKI